MDWVRNAFNVLLPNAWGQHPKKRALHYNSMEKNDDLNTPLAYHDGIRGGHLSRMEILEILGNKKIDRG